jgi:RNA polymerase sigma-70 factor, ECF subfamily
MRLPLPSAKPDWKLVCDQIISNENSAIEFLYKKTSCFQKALRYRLGTDAGDDVYHDVIVDLIGQIRRGAIREPERLMAYIATIAQRKVVAHWQAQQPRHTELSAAPEPVLAARAEIDLIRQEQTKIAQNILRALPQRDREVLIRFYLREETPEQICRALRLSQTQFRLIKWRAKAQFEDRCRKSLRTGPVPEAGICRRPELPVPAY